MIKNQNLWTLKELVALTFLPSANASICRNIVEQFTHFDQMFLQYELNPYLKKICDSNIFFQTIFREALAQAENQLELCEKFGVNVYSWIDSLYPSRLRNINYPPFLLYSKGLITHESVATVGIVGTRRCSDYGREVSKQFVEKFVENNVVTISGLANGIDTYIHQYTLKNQGITYAIIASGIDKISPKHSSYLAEKIIDSGGVVLSEYRCGTVALQGYFPQRNRIISGLSDAVVVIESGAKGGALITAQFAFDQNRPLFAVPGSIFSEKSNGTNALIQKNLAAPAITADDILKEIGITVKDSVVVNQHNLDTFEQKVVSFLSNGALTIDDLAVRLNIPTHDLLSTLLMLEFKGIIRQLPGKQFVKC